MRMRLLRRFGSGLNEGSDPDPDRGFSLYIRIRINYLYHPKII